MLIQPLLHGILLALGLILPLGPQNVFVLSQGISQPVISRAFVSALSAALCDTLLILLAICGVSTLVLTFPVIRTVLSVIGCSFLTYLGWCIWRDKSGVLSTERKDVSIVNQILFTVSVSLLNPHAILDTIGVIGTSALRYDGSAKIAFTAACLLVSWLWFFGLIFAGRYIRQFQPKMGAFSFNKFAAIIMWMSATYMIYLIVV